MIFVVTPAPLFEILIFDLKDFQVHKLKFWSMFSIYNTRKCYTKYNQHHILRLLKTSSQLVNCFTTFIREFLRS